jgi:hypothetical protein
MTRRCLLLTICLTFIAGLAFSQALSFPGELGVGDTKLGKYFDSYSLQLSSGDRVVATLSSADFDAYLLIESPQGREIENDDYSDSDDARLDILVDTPGVWKIKVTSYEEDEAGEYLLLVNREKLKPVETYSGVLDISDPVSIKDEHYDRYTLRFETGQRILINMDSDDFDAYLVLRPPRGRTISNDDYNEEYSSRIDTITEEGGVYELFATSAEGGELGRYSLRVLTGGQAKIDRREGSMGQSYGNEHTLSLASGEHVIVEMFSADFDTFLEVQGPEGFYDMNDDYGGSTSVSRLELFASQAGDYIFTAGSYEEQSSGAYLLTIYSFE